VIIGQHVETCDDKWVTEPPTGTVEAYQAASVDSNELRELKAGDLADAVRYLGIEDWSLAAGILRAADRAPEEPCLPEPKPEGAVFMNMFAGTIAERIFREDHLEPMEGLGFSVKDYVEQGDNRDYGLLRDGHELPINVKVAATLYREALSHVGLQPQDCIPISVYKALGASEMVPDLVYVDLVDFELGVKVRAFLDALDGPFAIGRLLLSHYGGAGIRRAQNRYIEQLFNQHGTAMRVLARKEGQDFRVISAQRVLSIMRDNPRRVPGLGVKGVGRTWRGEVNVHISVKDETLSWTEVADTCVNEGINEVLAAIGRTEKREAPAPKI
jgi:hypothetical protein